MGDPCPAPESKIQNPHPGTGSWALESSFYTPDPKLLVTCSGLLALYFGLLQFSALALLPPLPPPPRQTAPGREVPPHRLRQKLQPHKCSLGLVPHPTSHLGVPACKLTPSQFQLPSSSHISWSDFPYKISNIYFIINSRLLTSCQKFIVILIDRL